jgi:hypothetical protein
MQLIFDYNFSPIRIIFEINLHREKVKFIKNYSRLNF